MGGAFTAVADDGVRGVLEPGGLRHRLLLQPGRSTPTPRSPIRLLVALGDPAARALVLPDRYRRGKERPKHARSAPCRRVAGAVPRGTPGARDDPEIRARDRVRRAGTGRGAFPPNKFDADVGVMTTGSLGQLGLSIRNLLQPEFQSPGRGDSSRSARPGRGVDSRGARTSRSAADLDLTTATTPRGRLAGRGDRPGGATRSGRPGVRGGVHLEYLGTLGDRGRRRSAHRGQLRGLRRDRWRMPPGRASGRPSGIGVGGSGCVSSFSRRRCI